MTLAGYIILLILALLDIAEIILDKININYAKKISKNNQLPSFLNQEDLNKSLEYQSANINLETFKSIIDTLFIIFIFVSGLIQQYANYVLSISSKEFIQALIFLFGIQLVMGFIDLPFALYKQFVIEERFGFNKMNLALFFKDLILSSIISFIIFSIILFAIISFINYFEKSWWIIGSIFVFFFIIIINYLYPTLIAPLFNKFEPITDSELLEKINELSTKSGFDLNKIFKMDASKRSTHGNAYFTGFGRKKRVVLFDTILDKLNSDEIVSVLAHELGHFKHKHIVKNIIISFLIITTSFYITYTLINKDFIYEIFGFQKSLATGFFIISILLSPAKFIISPIFSAISRKFEYQADAYALSLIKQTTSFKNALIKLYKDNLSNPFPHPLYVKIYYSHPPLLDRIKRIDDYGN
ncbi:peptidase, M48 family [Deferribacter desulfuricans SSM1]|uniref:Peptidase, M48 family n=1 Tax=Deferribacter desulfuricans (strain DSM 14783 / JCM 11476 / NBRC 101012 / SSM1) TaxID=639282 RepID=D3P9M2_DEFDS|nr:M48 family metallopeptidase [Deferribacter desulfuricans]BAI81412.1 peptidase, M48 family [Deferribacter desulfuricans SSM1]